MNGITESSHFKNSTSYFARFRSGSDGRITLIADDVVDSVLKSKHNILHLMTASTIGLNPEFERLLCAQIKANVKFWPEEFFFRDQLNYNNNWLKVIDLREEITLGRLNHLTLSDRCRSQLQLKQNQQLCKNVNRRKLLAPLPTKKLYVVTEEDIINMYKPEEQPNVTSDTKTTFQKEVRNTSEGTLIEEITTTVVTRTTFIPKVTARKDQNIIKPMSFLELPMTPRARAKVINDTARTNPKILNPFLKRRQNAKLVAGNENAPREVSNFMNLFVIF